MTPSQRVSEHPGECLTVSNKQLLCRACREELSLIGSVVHNHVKSAKHQARKKRLGTKAKCEQDNAKALKASDEVTHPIGETLPQDFPRVWFRDYSGPANISCEGCNSLSMSCNSSQQAGELARFTERKWIPFI